MPAEEERLARCLDGVGPAGGRGVMQGVGGNSSVSHSTQGVTSLGWEGERRREGERGHGVRGRSESSISGSECV